MGKNVFILCLSFCQKNEKNVSGPRMKFSKYFAKFLFNSSFEIGQVAVSKIQNMF